MSIISDQEENAEQLCQRIITHFEVKANHNKNESLRCFIVIIVCTLLTPLFIALSPAENVWLSKVIPSVLSVVAAGAAGWLQQRKPQQLWSLYRTAQRELEVQKLKFLHQIEEYETAPAPRKILAQKIAAVILSTHQQWMPIVPSPDNLKLLESKGKAEDILKNYGQPGKG